MPLSSRSRPLRNQPRVWLVSYLHARHASSSAHIVRPSRPATPELDPSFAPFLRSVDLSIRGRPSKRSELEVVSYTPGRGAAKSGVNEAEGESDLDEEMEMDGRREEGRREERRSPAAVLGSKRLGIAILPEELVSAVQAAIHGQSSRPSNISFRNLPSARSGLAVELIPYRS